LSKAGPVGSIVLFDIVLRCVSLLVLVPLAQGAVAWIVAQSGAVAVSNNDIAGFVISLPGALFLVIGSAALLLSAFIRRAGFVHIVAQARAGGDASALAAIWALVTRAPSVLKFGVLQASILLLAALPFAAAAAVVFVWMSRGYDLQFLVSNRPPRFWVGAGLGGVIAVAGLLVHVRLRVRWMFAAPLLILRDRTPREALNESRELVGSDKFRFVRWLALWWGGWALAGALAFAAVDGFAGLAFAWASAVPPLVLVAALILLFVAVTEGAAIAAWAGEARWIVERYHERAPGPLPADEPRASRTPLLVAGAIAAVTLALAGLIGEFTDLDRPVAITAHRGSSRAAPENTLSALRQAIEDGADYAEIDVLELKDDAIVLFHDSDLRRIANDPRRSSSLTLEEFRAIDVGAWFSEKFRGERVGTLAEAIDVAGDRLQLNIELKLHGGERRLVEGVVEIVRAKGFEQRCVITSLDAATIRKVRSIAPELPAGLIVFEALGDLSRLDVDFLSLADRAATRDVIRRAHAAQIAVHVWTVNDRASMTRFIERGADNLITDEPALARTVLNERKSMNDAEKILSALRQRWRD